jgi:hypothetical protein
MKKAKCTGGDPCHYCFEHSLPCSYPEALNRQAASATWYWNPGPKISVHASSLTHIACSSTYELRQQQIESRLSRIEMNLGRSIQLPGGTPGVAQDEYMFGSDSYPPIVSSTPFFSISGEDKVAFPPFFNHMTSAVRNALDLSGVLATHNRVQDDEATRTSRRRASVKPTSDKQFVSRELHALGLDTVSRLVGEFHEDCFPLYPAVDIDSVQNQVNSFFSPASWGPEIGTELLVVDDLDTLKAIIAIAMQFSDDLQSPLKYNLLSYLNWDTSLCFYEGMPTIEDIQISTLIVRLEADLRIQVT